MRSASSSSETSSSDPVVDRARDRIRDAAIACFATDGVAATSVRTIAAEADVSPALVIHHFGSKDGLRAACDEHVAATIREQKRTAMEAGAQFDPLAALRGAGGDTQQMLRYLARTLVDGSPHVVGLVDELVDDAEAYMRLGVETGLLRPSTDPRGRAVVLTMWSLGALVLHEHLGRLLGADLTADVAGTVAYTLPAAEILGEGVFAAGVAERVRDALAGVDVSEEGKAPR